MAEIGDARKKGNAAMDVACAGYCRVVNPYRVRMDILKEDASPRVPCVSAKNALITVPMTAKIVVDD